MILPLLWKDIRLNKFVVLATLFLVDTPYLTTLFGLSIFTGDPETNTSIAERLMIAFPFSLFFLALVSAFIGGSPMTSEKAERTDRFLDYLPPSRLQVVSSKLIVALVLFALAWIGPTLAYYGARSEAKGDVMLHAVRYALSASLILFGLSWLASLFIRSSMLCGLAAFFGWIAVLLVIKKFVVVQPRGKFNLPQMVDGLLWVGVAVAITSLLLGVILFLRTPADS